MSRKNCCKVGTELIFIYAVATTKMKIYKGREKEMAAVSKVSNQPDQIFEVLIRCFPGEIIRIQLHYGVTFSHLKWVYCAT